MPVIKEVNNHDDSDGDKKRKKNHPQNKIYW